MSSLRTAENEQPAAIPIKDGNRAVRPRTDGQGRYLKALQENELVFCIGPAGTGKTYLAVAVAVSLLRGGRIKKIVLVRPAVEAGEHLGFLPGDLEAKINPYLRPLLDALHDLMEYEQIRRYMDNDLIEIAPLAYMRGRTLNDAVIILDEGQNATVPQMKMFLTRMGQNARIVVTGDITQVDLPIGTRSGLADAVERLRDMPGRGHDTARSLGHRPPPPGAGDRGCVRSHRAGQRARRAFRERGSTCNRKADWRPDRSLPQFLFPPVRSPRSEGEVDSFGTWALLDQKS